MKRFLVQIAMRPSGRAALQALDANKRFTTTFQDKAISSTAVVRNLVKTGGSAQMTLGTTAAVSAQDAQGNVTYTGAVVSVDTNAVKQVGHDKTGVTTMVHEIYHATDFQQQKSYSEVAKGDKPTAATGPAEAFGKSVSQEKPDISKKEAKKVVEEMLKK